VEKDYTTNDTDTVIILLFK